MLIDREIREALAAGDIIISPDDGIDARIQPASLDVRLAATFAKFASQRCAMVDPKVDTTGAWDFITADEYVVAPGELVLASTWESIQLAGTILGRVEGKSSLGRLGVLVHATAGYIDPGWAGPITLEISVALSVPVKLWAGMPIAQLAFQEVAAVTAGYSGRYAGQVGPTPSRYHHNWTGTRWI